ncbi:Coenzyme F420 hydrogenase/dehydrogenase, beta subunit C-terminal domain [Aeromicrobium chenweiae]|nr:Coenzyme F420 hydrogenase/dehydrogenase, beta subunit C-terminal domain [Aeromicrobium chenweiae]
MNTEGRALLQALRRYNLFVASGAHELAVDDSTTVLDKDGLPAAVFPSRELSDAEVTAVLAVSAFARTGEPEHVISERLFATQAGVRLHPVAGYYAGAYAGAVNDDKDRARSSSGGLTTWFLQTLVRQGHVDGVIHMKASDDTTALFSYAISRTSDEIAEGAKTRYFPGHVGPQLREIMNSNETFAIVGIPSILYEMRLAVRQFPNLGKRLKYFVGLICGHQKSAHYADALAWQVGIPPGELTDIDFRLKIPGQKASAYGVAFHGRDAQGTPITAQRPASELYGTDWGLGFFKANFSDHSDDVFNETADIVFGDAWLPGYVDDSRGHNVVLTRAQELDEMLTRGADAGEIKLDTLDVAQVVQSQGGLVRHGRELLPTRLKYFASRGEFVPPQRFELGAPAGFARRRLQQLRVRMSRRSHHAYAASVAAGDFSVFPQRMRWLTREYRLAYRAVRLIAKARQR